MTHIINVLPENYWPIKCGKKTFEVCKTNQNYHLNDILVLREWTPDDGCTGEEIERSIGYIYKGDGNNGLAEDYCVLGLKRGRPTAVLDGKELATIADQYLR